MSGDTELHICGTRIIRKAGGAAAKGSIHKERAMSQESENRTERDIDREVENLRKELSALREEFSAQMDDWRKQAEDEAAGVVAGVKESLGEARARVREGLGSAGTYGKQMYDQVRSKVEERPMASALVAFGIGLILGKMLERR